MACDSPSELKFEIGHVLFIDIVGYSKLLINQQTEQLETLKTIVRGTEQFKKSEAERKLLRLPTGDGGALVFRDTPEAPVLCALEIAKALKAHPDLKVRMGIHSGPVNEVSDLNEQANVAGAGINIAQRVMDCGDAGHILLSKHVADDLEHYPHWQPHLHSLGECEVKYGVRLGIVNLHNNEVGNPSVPAKINLLKRRRAQRRLAACIAFIGALAIVWVGRDRWARRDARPDGPSLPIPDKSIAVLPFENLSDDKSNAYFANGIQDEILTKLASVADLKVISRTSTAKYKSKPEDLKTVSQQLGVSNVLEGSVQKAGDKVRVNVQLIDARVDSHLWAKTFDREIKDVFVVESEVAQDIANALQAKLSPKETNNLAAAPTQDSEAYDLFLRGEHEQLAGESSLNAEAFDRAATWYEQAIGRDPNFSLAIARWVESRCKHHHWGDAMSETEVEKVREAADRAFRLAPDLAEAHMALGLFYYYCVFQYQRAVSEFQHIVESQPNNVRALSYLANIHFRQGQFERTLSELKKCEKLDPRDPGISDSIGGAYLDLRMWEKAKRAGLHALALDPHNVAGMHIVFFSDLGANSDVNEARRILQTFPPDNGSFGFIPGGVTSLLNLNAYVCVIGRDFGAAYKVWGDESKNPTANRLRLSARAVLHVLSGDAAAAQSEMEKAHELVEVKLHEQFDDADSMIQLSWIDLALKRNDEALKLAKRAVDLVPIETDAVAGTFVLAASAEIQARAGQPAEAIKTLQRLLSMPAGLQASIARLKIDPVWDPIRNHPGFQQLLAGTELVGPNK